MVERKDLDSEAHDALGWNKHIQKTDSRWKIGATSHWYAFFFFWSRRTRADPPAWVSVSPLWVCESFRGLIHVSVILEKLTFLSVAHQGETSGKLWILNWPEVASERKLLSGECWAPEMWAPLGFVRQKISLPVFQHQFVKVSDAAHSAV